MRCRKLPPGIFSALQDADLVLHAGDVGELAVLDSLSRLAPVTAVHGNDDSEESRRYLPYRTVVACAGVRILLWHSHYEDRQQEFASREGDAFQPKLQRIAHQALEAGAHIAVFGHWHIPLVREVNGVTLINPGAVASGNEITRQLVQTAAVLEIRAAGLPTVRHIDLAYPHGTYDAGIDWDAGFKAALQRYSASILAPELLDRLPSMLGQISDEDQAKLHHLVLRHARRCWDGEIDQITAELVRSELAIDRTLSADDRKRFIGLLS